MGIDMEIDFENPIIISMRVGMTFKMSMNTDISLSIPYV